MSTTLWLFPDVQELLVYGLEDLAGGEDHTGTETPDNLAEVLPFIRVNRTSGPSTLLNDYANVDLEVFGATYAETERLAERIRQWLVGPPPPLYQFDKVICDNGPRELPWGDGNQVRRFAATYQIISRRQKVTLP